MGDHDITNELVSPSVNDVNGGVAGDGVNTLEKYAAPWRLGVERNYVISGFAIPASSGTLDIAIPLGKAMISGYYISVPGSTTVTCAASTTNHIFLKLTRDGSNNVAAAKFEVNTTGTAPADSVKIATAITSGAAVTSTADKRVFEPFAPSLSRGPADTGTGSTAAHEYDVTISSNQNLSGIHFYRNFTLNSGVTITVPAGGFRLVIIASESITINGTINAAGAGQAGAPGNSSGGAATAAADGTDQPGGGGASSTAGGNGTQVSGAAALQSLMAGLFGQVAGGGGGGGSGGDGGVTSPGGAGGGARSTDRTLLAAGGTAGAAGCGSASVAAGGAGGGSIVLIAPQINLAATAVLNTSGNNGSVNGIGPGSGGGGAGNILMASRTYTDNGATFTQNGGVGANGGASCPSKGGDGAAGVKEILIY
jgi:hypothetical protein